MSATKINFTVELDPTDGWTLENAEQYSGYELGLLMRHLPAAIKAIRRERKLRSIKRRCLRLEQKTVWTFSEALWYSCFSGRVRSDKGLDDALERYEMFRERVEGD